MTPTHTPELPPSGPLYGAQNASDAECGAQDVRVAPGASETPSTPSDASERPQEPSAGGVSARPSPHEAAVALFVEQAAELRLLRGELARSRRRECTALCDDVEMDRDELAKQLDEARGNLARLGRDHEAIWREFRDRADWGQRMWNAWHSARQRAVRIADERDAWRAIAESHGASPHRPSAGPPANPTGDPT